MFVFPSLFFYNMEVFMHIILFLDQKDGMIFGNKRQTKDKILMKYIEDVSKGSCLFTNHFSTSLFDNIPSHLIVDDNFLNIAKSEDFCIVENEDIEPYMNKIESIRIYRWDKVYPSTIKFNKDLLKNWKQSFCVELFLGGTHQVIYEEMWVRKEMCK